MQDDLLFPMLTVEETLSFSAEFCLPRTFSASKKKAHTRVQALIDQLGLCAAANTIIGDEGHRGVSSRERRCVFIGTDKSMTQYYCSLMNQPWVLIQPVPLWW
ncbi:ABC transporter G family member 2 [Carex littledalei]|uniref:ABC transporter G family member 2 n=1 Tax=Carex littledalei TaxID=544730 RepID=A0A833QNJ0_9POAL|nr:ABC transporter G family member 2 [Carex littledalei]